MDDPGYKAYIFPKRSKSTQGGASVILIKSEYTPYISVVEFLYDTIIWLKLSKNLVNLQKDLFIAFTYLPPCNSVFFKDNDVDKAISFDEIKEAIGNLKPGKSHGEDGISNEYFIEFQDYFDLFYINFLIVY